MPELPEVETIRRQLAPWLAGSDRWSRHGRTRRPKFTAARRRDRRDDRRLGRRGKYLIVALDDDRRADRPPRHDRPCAPPTEPRPALEPDPYVRAWWELDDGAALEFRDVRRFGRIAVVPPRRLRALPRSPRWGPSRSTTTSRPSSLWPALAASRRAVKTQLLSQRPVAGVGNIYADEALWVAGVHPARRRVTRPQAARLHAASARCSRPGSTTAARRCATTSTPTARTGANQHHLRCYGRGGEPCERCGTTLRRTVSTPAPRRGARRANAGPV